MGCGRGRPRLRATRTAAAASLRKPARRPSNSLPQNSPGVFVRDELGNQKQSRSVDVRFGSLADIGEGYQGCPLYPQHSSVQLECPKSAISGHCGNAVERAEEAGGELTCRGGLGEREGTTHPPLKDWPRSIIHRFSGPAATDSCDPQSPSAANRPAESSRSGRAGRAANWIPGRWAGVPTEYRP